MCGQTIVTIGSRVNSCECVWVCTYETGWVLVPVYICVCPWWKTYIMCVYKIFSTSVFATWCLCVHSCVFAKGALLLPRQPAFTNGCVSPVSALARSPLPAPRARRGWPDSLRCWPSWRCRCAVCADSGRPPSSPAPHRRSMLMCTGGRERQDRLETNSRKDLRSQGDVYEKETLEE